jgi:hypothetical protein
MFTDDSPKEYMQFNAEFDTANNLTSIVVVTNSPSLRKDLSSDLTRQIKSGNFAFDHTTKYWLRSHEMVRIEEGPALKISLMKM